VTTFVAKARDEEDRHRTHALLIRNGPWLWREHPEVLFDRLAVFQGRFTLEAVEVVCTGHGLAVAEVVERLAGACMGFLSAPARRALHSHIAGVAPGTQRRGVGFALKLHQRAWALGHGLPLAVFELKNRWDPHPTVENALNQLAMSMLKRTAYYRDARKNLKKHARAQITDAGRDQAARDGSRFAFQFGECMARR